MSAAYQHKRSRYAELEYTEAGVTHIYPVGVGRRGFVSTSTTRLLHDLEDRNMQVASFKLKLTFPSRNVFYRRKSRMKMENTSKGQYSWKYSHQHAPLNGQFKQRKWLFFFRQNFKFYSVFVINTLHVLHCILELQPKQSIFNLCQRNCSLIQTNIHTLIYA